MQNSIPPNFTFPPNVDPTTYAFTAFIIGAILVGDLNVNEQNALGNWLMLLAQYILTNASQQQLIEGRLEKYNININSRKAKSGGSIFTTDSEKSNQSQRDEVDFILQEIQRIEQELINIKKNSNP